MLAIEIEIQQHGVCALSLLCVKRPTASFTVSRRQLHVGGPVPVSLLGRRALQMILGARCKRI